MHHLGFFVSPNGASLDQQDVFAAFGNMLGEDFSKYLKNLSEAVKNNNDSPASTKIFEDLKTAWHNYENK